MATLYRKYRPQTFADLIGQDHIRQTLQAALAQEKVSHAYLFTGPRGVGKTTVARLLAKAINCPQRGVGEIAQGEPCNTCQICLDITEGRSLDVMEIDAASNRGIDEIRDLREKIKFAPSLAKKKVFIIDEVHMLTKEAFNALLKTLEEPPAHAVFVLATTELHRVPVTIASRCQVFVFKKAQLSQLVERLGTVAAAEGLKLGDAAAAFVARLAGGSYRDAVSLLDQLSSFTTEPITIPLIQNALGFASEERILSFFEALDAASPESALTVLASTEASGIDLEHFVTQLIDAGRYLLYRRLGTTLAVPFETDDAPRWEQLVTSWTEARLLQFLEGLVAVRQAMKHSPIPPLPLELWILGLFTVRVTSHLGEKVEAAASPKAKAAAPVRPPPTEEFTAPPAESTGASPEPVTTTEASPSHQSALTVKEWQMVLERIKPLNMSLYSLLNQAEFGGSASGRVLVWLSYQFAVDRLKERKHRELVERTIDEVFGGHWSLDCQVRVAVLSETVAIPEAPELLEAAAELFGVDDGQSPVQAN